MKLTDAEREKFVGILIRLVRGDAYYHELSLHDVKDIEPVVGTIIAARLDAARTEADAREAAFRERAAKRCIERYPHTSGDRAKIEFLCAGQLAIEIRALPANGDALRLAKLAAVNEFIAVVTKHGQSNTVSDALEQVVAAATLKEHRRECTVCGLGVRQCERRAALEAAAKGQNDGK